MSRRKQPNELSYTIEPSELLYEYVRLTSSISSTSSEDIGRQLPGLCDQVASLSESQEELRGFMIGVSFTQNYSLFDYELYQVNDDGSEEFTTNLVKEPINGSHHYITFPYPADPHFDNATLRGTILSELARRIRDLIEGQDDPDETSFSHVWGLLADQGGERG